MLLYIFTKIIPNNNLKKKRGSNHNFSFSFLLFSSRARHVLRGQQEKYLIHLPRTVTILFVIIFHVENMVIKLGNKKKKKKE